MPRIAVCLLLLCASTSVAARAPMHGSNGDNSSCPEIAAAVAAADARSTKARGATPVPVASRKSSKPTARGGGGDSEGSPRLQAPRWHSFLPGMFR